MPGLLLAGPAARNGDCDRRGVMPPLSRLRNTLALFLLFAPHTVQLIAQQTPVAQSTVRFSDAPHPLGVEKDRGTQQWLCARVVDGLTGRPIAAAELFLVAESRNPIRGEFSWAMRSTSDDDGILRMRVDELAPDYAPWSWIVVRADGYVPRMSMTTFEDPIVRLSPAMTVPVEILDWRDRPVADALVGFCGGCGHTPDLVHARTDANGIAQLPGLDAVSGIEDIYIEHPDLGLSSDAGSWVPGQWPMRIRPPRGTTAVGVLLDEKGHGIAGAYVGEKQCHRGPWVQTAKDGSFELCGASRRDDLWVNAKGRQFVFDRPLQQPYRLQLPTAPEDLESLPQDYVEAVDLPDGQRMPRSEAKHAVMPRTSTHFVTLRVANLPADGNVSLRTRHTSIKVSDAVRAGSQIALPDEPFAIAIEDGAYRLRVFSYEASDAARLAGGVLRLKFFDATRIEGQVKNAAGKPLAVRLALVHRYYQPRSDEDPHWQDSRGAISMTTPQEGLRMLLVQDQSHHHRMRMIPVMLPRQGDDLVVDVGTIVLRKQPQIRVVRPDGEPLREGSIELIRAGWHDTERGSKYAVVGDGLCTLPDLRQGDTLLIRSSPSTIPANSNPKLIDLPSRFVLQGHGPWLLQQHGGKLLIDANTIGTAKYIAVTIGDRLLKLRGPSLLRGLAPGNHKLFVTAAGHRTAIATVNVSESSVERFAVTLPEN